MTAFKAGVGLLWLLSLLAGRAWHPAAASAIHAAQAEATAQPPAIDSEVVVGPSVEPDDLAGEPADPRWDLFGNEIEDAIADYRIDLRGSVYERHSPETAMQRLGSPST